MVRKAGFGILMANADTKFFTGCRYSSVFKFCWNARSVMTFILIGDCLWVVPYVVLILRCQHIIWKGLYGKCWVGQQSYTIWRTFFCVGRVGTSQCQPF